uniref:PcfK-like protein n=1 Tax=Myoviridae sp. ctKkB1 TaxID=2825081 RepID=A0A8S5V498_9CAUD|nr:MAG TPA: PcfK-like protein [Myoviridae sp. ctKkB1]
MVEDETVYSWIREYYGITEEPKTDNIISLDLADLL